MKERTFRSASLRLQSFLESSFIPCEQSCNKFVMETKQQTCGSQWKNVRYFDLRQKVWIAISDPDTGCVGFSDRKKSLSSSENRRRKTRSGGCPCHFYPFQTKATKNAGRKWKMLRREAGWTVALNQVNTNTLSVLTTGHWSHLLKLTSDKIIGFDEFLQ